MSKTWHIVGFSGGIDSQACARFVLNREDHDNVILINSDAGGNEHPLTTEFVQNYSDNVHPVVMLSPIVADMDGRTKKKQAELGLKDSDPLSFDTMALLKGRFPSSQAQFCTYHLKIAPQKRWMDENIGSDDEVIRYAGVRRDESRRRADCKITSWDEYFDCPFICPIADWTKDMCFDYVKAHDEEYNQLYTLGFNRVGCAPCINSSKADILAWVQRFPEMIDKVRDWEKRVGRTFFAPCVPGKELNFIDDVVAWSKTVWGGKQQSLESITPRPSCESKYGLCE